MALSMKRLFEGLKIIAKATLTGTGKGELEVLDSDGSLNYHNGTTSSKVTTNTHAATLTSKTVVVASNTITTAASGNLAATELNAALAELQTDIDTRTTTTDFNNHLTDATDAHDASAISNVAAGNLVATDVQAALNELQGDIDTGATNLTNHLNDTADAHDASAISNVPTGNLVATDVQAALDELQGDIDTANTNLSNHLSDTADAHDASAISSVPAGNLAATEVQAALNELQTDIDTRALDSALTTHISDTTTHGTTGNIVGTSDAQVLTNKDIDGGTASNTSRLTIPKASKATLDGLTRKEGTLVYASDFDKLYKDDGSTLTEVGSGSGTGIDFLLLGDAESGTTGWNSYKDAAGAVPVDGTGGTITVGHTFTQSSSSPLNGLNSFLITKPASDCQGEGFSKDCTIPEGYRTHTSVWRGIVSTDANYVDGDYVFYGYDVTGSVAQEPAQLQLMANSAGKFYVEFQIPAGCASFRVIIHCATTSATTRAIKLDDMIFGPTESARGPVFAGPFDYPAGAVAWASSGTQPAIGNGTLTAKYWRIANKLRCSIEVVAGTTTTFGTGDYRWTLPAPYTVHADVVNNGTVGIAEGGVSVFDDSAGVIIHGFVGNDGPNLNYVRSRVINSTTNQAAMSATNPFTLANLDRISVHFEVEVNGLENNQVVSEDFGTREVSFKAVLATSNQTVSATTETTIIFNSTAAANEGFDKTASFNTTTGTFTVPESGTYYFASSVNLASYTDADSTRLVIKRGSTIIGVSEGRSSSTAMTLTAVALKDLIKGELITVTIDSETDASYAITTGSQFLGFKLASNQQIASAEIVKAKYTTSTQSISSATETDVIYGTLVEDSHNAMNISTGVYTVPVSGTYNVSGLNMFSGFTGTAGNIVYSDVEKNNSSYGQGLRSFVVGTASINYTTIFNVDVPCIKGDTLKTQVYQNSGGAVNLLNGSTVNYVQIKRIGGVA